MSKGLTRMSVLSAFLRSFFIQASWNYHTMIGNGFAFAMLPALRHLFGDDREKMDEAVRRHIDHFNAHPYLAGVALGAALRLEADGTDPETIRRFKTAVRGPLGGLGDALVWATWLPAVSTAALALWWLGVPEWAVICFFLVVYNAGHLVLRFWGFTAGLKEGRSVATALGRVNLGAWTTRIEAIATLVLGAMVGAALAGPAGILQDGWVWVGLAAFAFIVGSTVGHRAWRPSAAIIVTLVALLTTWGVLT